MRKIYAITTLLVSFYIHQVSLAQTGLAISAAPGMFLSEMRDGESLFLKHVEECLAIIDQEARKTPMTGVAMAAFIPGDSTSTWTSKMKVVGKLADDEVNLLGIVYTKAAEMAVTLRDSGNAERKNMRGEYGYEGGVIKKVRGGYLVCAFSGGKSEDDVDAARKGLEWLASKYSR